MCQFTSLLTEHFDSLVWSCMNDWNSIQIILCRLSNQNLTLICSVKLYGGLLYIQLVTTAPLPLPLKTMRTAHSLPTPLPRWGILTGPFHESNVILRSRSVSWVFFVFLSYLMFATNRFNRFLILFLRLKSQENTWSSVQESFIWTVSCTIWERCTPR